MTRVSLKEAYDNKDVVAQIYAIRDIAEGAEDTANGAVSTANTASEHVDALVPQVEGAVQNANNASASAQASAQTVAGYEDRVTELETADGQNVKLSGDQNITGIKTVPTEATGSRSQQIANSTKIGTELDNYTPMVRTTGNTVKSGLFTLTTPQSLIASTSANYNNILLESSTQYNRIISRVRNATGNQYDQHFDLGTSYATAGINNVSLRAFAPRKNLGDSSEKQANLSVSIHVEDNDTGYVALTFIKKDGTQKVKRIGTFNGTDWS